MTVAPISLAPSIVSPRHASPRRTLRRPPWRREPPPQEGHGAFDVLLLTHLDRLEDFARHLAPQAAEANDLVQETCRRALERRAQFDVGTNLRAWLNRIMLNVHRDRCRRRRREVPGDVLIEQLPAPPVVPPASWSLVSDNDLKNAVDALDPIYRTPYILRFVNGLRYDEIATLLGLPLSTIGTRLRRARLALRRRLVVRLGRGGHGLD